MAVDTNPETGADNDQAVIVRTDLFDTTAGTEPAMDNNISC